MAETHSGLLLQSLSPAAATAVPPTASAATPATPAAAAAAAFVLVLLVVCSLRLRGASGGTNDKGQVRCLITTPACFSLQR